MIPTIIADDKGVNCFTDDLGQTCFVDDLNQFLCCNNIHIPKMQICM